MNNLKAKRDKAANDLCCEVRYQLANNIIDQEKLHYFLVKWMELTGKTKYERPKFKSPEPF